jgi:threonine dehydratase
MPAPQVPEPPTFEDILAAQRRIAPHLSPTPLHRYAALDELIGAEVYVKHENHQPVGAFKVRGGLNLIAQLTGAERAAGVVTASTGNHGLSIAFAAIRALGAKIVEDGDKFDDAAVKAQQLAQERGMRFIHSANEPRLIAGVATVALEMLQARPGLDCIITAVGLGSGAAGACLAAQQIDPGIRVIGVQAAASPAVHDAWRSGRIERRPNQTLAEGVATGEAAELTLRILRARLADFWLVGEEDILRGIVWWIERAHTLAESAAAATLAGAYVNRARIAGRRIGVVCSGGNLSLAQLGQALAATGGSNESVSNPLQPAEAETTP